MNEKKKVFFCENVKWLRILYKLSLEEMALILGVSESQLSLIERDIIPPSLPFSVLTQLDKHFSVPPEIVFSILISEENT